MIVANGQYLSTGGFGSFENWAESERWIPRTRDYRLNVRRYHCPVCKAKPGESCVRMSLKGPVPRALPHFGRSPPLGRIVTSGAERRVRE